MESNKEANHAGAVYDFVEELADFVDTKTQTYPKEILQHLGIRQTHQTSEEVGEILVQLGWEKPAIRGSRYWTRHVPAQRRESLQKESDEQRIVAFLLTKGGLWSRTQVAELFPHLSPTQTSQSLKRLVDQGRLQTLGDRRGMRYFVINKD